MGVDCAGCVKAGEVLELLSADPPASSGMEGFGRVNEARGLGVEKTVSFCELFRPNVYTIEPADAYQVRSLNRSARGEDGVKRRGPRPMKWATCSWCKQRFRLQTKGNVCWKQLDSRRRRRVFQDRTSRSLVALVSEPRAARSANAIVTEHTAATK